MAMDSAIPFQLIDPDEFDALEIAIAAAEHSSTSLRKKLRLSTSPPPVSCALTDSPPCASPPKCALPFVSHPQHSQIEPPTETARAWRTSDGYPSSVMEPSESCRNDCADRDLYCQISERPMASTSEYESELEKVLANAQAEGEQICRGSFSSCIPGCDCVSDANGADSCSNAVERRWTSPCSSSSEHLHEPEEVTLCLQEGMCSKRFGLRRLPAWESQAVGDLAKSARQPRHSTIARTPHQLSPPLGFSSDQCTDYNRLPWGLAPFKHRVVTKRELPKFQFKGQIIYSVTVSDAEKASQDLLNRIIAKKGTLGETIPLGFDAEWKVVFQRGAKPRKIAVLQLCVDAYHCNIFHVIHTGIPFPLRTILEDPSVFKVGVGAYGDAAKLFAHYKVKVNSVKDLNGLANLKLAGAAFARRTWSLASLAEELLGKQIDKNGVIRMGDWEVEALSELQLQYAATDAFASLYLFQVLCTFPDLEKEVFSSQC